MASEVGSLLSSLRSFFGGNRRTPEEKVSESGGLFDRILAKTPLQDPKKKPSQEMLSPIPERQVLDSPEYQNPSPSPSPSPSPTTQQTVQRGFIGGEIPQDLLSIIRQAAQEQQVNEAVLSALLFQESRFNPTASGGNPGSLDRGIAQINNVAHPEVTDAQAYDPSFAIPFAAQLLRSNIDRFGGDMSRGIAAYNVGPGGASIEGPAPYGGGPRGQQYIDSIAQYLDPQTLQELGIITSP